MRELMKSQNILQFLAYSYLKELDQINTVLKRRIQEHQKVDDTHYDRLKEIIGIIEANGKLKKQVESHLEKIINYLSNEKATMNNDDIPLCFLDKKLIAVSDIVYMLDEISNCSGMNTFEIKDYYFDYKEANIIDNTTINEESFFSILSKFYSNFFCMIRNSFIEKHQSRHDLWIITEKGELFLGDSEHHGLLVDEINHKDACNFFDELNKQDEYMSYAFYTFYEEIKKTASSKFKDLNFSNFYLIKSIYNIDGKICSEIKDLSGSTVLIKPFFFTDQRSLYVDKVYEEFDLLECIDEEGEKVFYKSFLE
jgi:hypothetical protein